MSILKIFMNMSQRDPFGLCKSLKSNQNFIARRGSENFTFPQTCLPAGRYSEMSGCGSSYFALRKSGYKNFTFTKYSEMTGYRDLSTIQQIHCSPKLPSSIGGNFLTPQLLNFSTKSIKDMFKIKTIFPKGIPSEKTLDNQYYRK
jgi:hypothetical protein